VGSHDVAPQHKVKFAIPEGTQDWMRKRSGVNRMLVQAVAENYLFAECTQWGAFKCPHRNSVVLLLATINDDRTVLLRERLIQDLNGLCGLCKHFSPLE